jgi:hypothetical protein
LRPAARSDARRAHRRLFAFVDPIASAQMLVLNPAISLAESSSRGGLSHFHLQFIFDSLII